MKFPGARSCLNPCIVCCVSRLDQPLSSYHIDALASRLSPHTRTSAVTIPRQLAPTMGPAHDGDEFLEGSQLGFRETHGFLDEEEPVWMIYIDSEFYGRKLFGQQYADRSQRVILAFDQLGQGRNRGRCVQCCCFTMNRPRVISEPPD